MDRSIDQLIKDAETTLKNAQKRKKADRWEAMSVSLDGMITYCEDMIELCQLVKAQEGQLNKLKEEIAKIKDAETKLVTNEDASNNS